MERFWSKVNKTDTCWLWTACITPNGYGLFKYKGKVERAHRIAYQVDKGDIPKGLVIDHLCRIKHCVNPDHLEAVTQRENVLRGESLAAINARKTHCKRGDKLSGDNLYLDFKGKRYCRICKKAASIKSYHAIKKLTVKVGNE